MHNLLTQPIQTWTILNRSERNGGVDPSKKRRGHHATAIRAVPLMILRCRVCQSIVTDRFGMENLNQAAPMEGGANSATVGAQGGETIMTSPATPTARPRRTRGRWRRVTVPRANTNTSRALPAAAGSSTGDQYGGIEAMERWPWMNRAVDEVPAQQVVERGSTEWVEAMERSNKRMMKMADELEQEDKNGCDDGQGRLIPCLQGQVGRFLSRDSRPLVYKTPPTDTQSVL